MITPIQFKLERVMRIIEKAHQRTQAIKAIEKVYDCEYIGNNNKGEPMFRKKSAIHSLNVEIKLEV